MEPVIDLEEAKPMGKRDCRQCRHYIAGAVYETDCGTEYDGPDCKQWSGVAGLKSFPFRNTKCSSWVSRPVSP